MIVFVVAVTFFSVAHAMDYQLEQRCFEAHRVEAFKEN